MRARGDGGHKRHGLLGFLDAIPPRLVADARALAAACVLAHEGNAAVAEVVLTLARDVVAEERLEALIEVGPALAVTVETGAEPVPTNVAARALGCSPYELRERRKRGEIAAMQARCRGRLQWEPAELARYKAAHTAGRLTSGLDQGYTAQHDKNRRGRSAAQTPDDASTARRGPRRRADDGLAMGTGETPRRPPRHASPVAPNAGAWASRPAWGDDAADPPPGEG